MADELTEALEELRTVFPDRLPFIRSEYSFHHNDAIYQHWASLADCMAQVRSWKAAQGEELNQ